MQKFFKFLKGFLLVVSFVITILATKNYQYLLYEIIDNQSIAGLLIFCSLMILLLVGIFISTFIHELGHLIFGLLTGYKFSSFRIGNTCFMKENGKIKIKRMGIPGTAGQCLMLPPELKDGKIPYKLYNLGGCLFNLIFTVVFIVLAIIIRNYPIALTVFAMLAVTQFLLLVNNGIPMRTPIIQNDGQNLIDIGTNKESVYSFYIQLLVSESLSRGLKLSEMPNEWFAMPSDENINNPIVATRGYLTCLKELELGNFYSAHKLIRGLLQKSTTILGVHKLMLELEIIYLDVIHQWAPYENVLLRINNLKKQLTPFKNSITVKRVLYTVALICENNLIEANKLLTAFEKFAKKYPYKQEVENERKLIELANEVHYKLTHKEEN